MVEQPAADVSDSSVCLHVERGPVNQPCRGHHRPRSTSFLAVYCRSNLSKSVLQWLIGNAPLQRADASPTPREILSGGETFQPLPMPPETPMVSLQRSNSEEDAPFLRLYLLISKCA